MSVEVFRDRDDDYLTWVEAHSAGYVINVGRSLSGVAKLHHAACRTIISRPPFTESYIKICSAALRDFDDWVLGYPGVDLSSCGTCQPPAYNASTEDSVPAQQVLSAPEAAEAELKSTATYEWEIDGPGAGKRWVRLWTDRYIPYERLTDDQRAARAALRARVRSLTAAPGEILHASFAGVTPDGMDVENVVLYNIDGTAGGCFQPGTRHGVRIETANALHGNAPSGRSRACSYEYGLTSPDSGFTHWRPTRPLARFTESDLGEFPSAKRLEQVWLAIRHTKDVHVADTPIAASDRVAIRLTLSYPCSRTAGANPEVVKALIDATVAAFQCHRDRTSVDEIGSRLARTTGKPADLIKQLLLDGSHAVLGATDRLVYLRGAGVQWNPADHLVVAAQVVCRPVPEATWSLSGEIHAVEPVS
ncbi:hypothetical protein [Mycolicibacterium alvei]|uniref:Uncharacterized protein n=1 Tax=Mycolicibacterium alvei TaxID=67081 RepID=A0A6N4UU94_9MYCO|nr:hypothetical protein [Mycolicibacterium alvei]MCV7002241.1 hypothetical protein [Mycolicibacterium alvei]BBX27413.1 hypothetical protein MALV_25380 [Mycolicibacterium alvei]